MDHSLFTIDYSQKSLIVIGGGAAGFFCAVNAARLHPGLKVIILEKSSKLLSKVKVSGGGRCNVTHACFSISEMVKRYPRGENFVKKTFHHFFTTDTVEWFKERGESLKTEADGRMFPITNNSQTIIDCLLAEANKYKVEIRMNAGVESFAKVNDRFEIKLSGDRVLHADHLCIASGGFPKSSQFDWLTQTGHSIQSPVPSLFTFNIPHHNITSLMGIAVPETVVKIVGTKLQQSGPLLITHWGLSGPAILKTSAWAARVLAEKNYEYKILVNWLPQYNENSLREKILQVRFDVAAQKIYNRNPFGLPSRLWEYLLNECGVKDDVRWADLPAKEQNKLVKILCAHEFDVKGKTTFKEEFVTAGGINLEEIDPSTMESRLVKGLFFAGEVIDVDGVTGGFNFQNAWTTGWIAAQLRSRN
ncbi:NAD(P)/FAD-dependent oxidoreductase [Ferruginibacter sp. HRS2-29]|uniref:NAD(P)/FAD-dependent oxidoreductase n=1 Tax=Ferruginibacter sp. HRS2-29 TaxID=2487334 RepID=UPI0020CB6F2D|nr:NAD(P)/FAD-dependent oxidoreductase [Ferruginibacter sp. HRS2-29]MCP9750751.1 NAD(P)/FAD-dependent oxidoreductase [Ferruginibacter sp. HRS2-29]